MQVHLYNLFSSDETSFHFVTENKCEGDLKLLIDFSNEASSLGENLMGNKVLLSIPDSQLDPVLNL